MLLHLEVTNPCRTPWPIKADGGLQPLTPHPREPHPTSLHEAAAGAAASQHMCLAVRQDVLLECLGLGLLICKPH